MPETHHGHSVRFRCLAAQIALHVELRYSYARQWVLRLLIITGRHQCNTQISYYISKMNVHMYHCSWHPFRVDRVGICGSAFAVARSAHGSDGTVTSECSCTSCKRRETAARSKVSGYNDTLYIILSGGKKHLMHNIESLILSFSNNLNKI